MGRVRLALTCNGPGEFSGWVRPFLRAFYAQVPDADIHLFFVPDDYATGAEPAVARAAFPSARVYDSKEYVRAAFGRPLRDLPERLDAVQYLGGDLMHAARLAKRFSAKALTYKFSRARYRDVFQRAFAVDLNNVEQLAAWRVHRDRIVLTGNLAIDGALFEAGEPSEPGAPEDGILIMPGSRRHEVRHLIPFFLTAATRIARERPDIAIAFGISAFTSMDDVRAAAEGGGDPRVFAEPGRVVTEGDRTYLAGGDGAVRFPVLRNALSAAGRARLVVTIPGTKTIELAALGKATIACVPMNAPEMVPINGPLTYLDRVPLLGIPLKRAAVLRVARRFTFVAQPNIDAGTAVMEELRGTLTPGRVARVALDRYADGAWLENSARRLRALYADHAGASKRMSAAVVEAL
ncbi:MAG: hypothetical protein NVS1B14_09670 [Vulcanimicrobiaceae bacterium]